VQGVVDHFVPWARHPDSGLDNLVVADARCNGWKGAWLAATDHLARWAGRFAPGDRLGAGLEEVARGLRHAWTNGFVERLQGPILHEPWRIEVRRRSFPSRAAMQRNLDAFLRFDNERRPRQGYRVRGRTPAELFWGVVPAAGHTACHALGRSSRCQPDAGSVRTPDARAPGVGHWRRPARRSLCGPPSCCSRPRASAGSVPEWGLVRPGWTR